MSDFPEPSPFPDADGSPTPDDQPRFVQPGRPMPGGGPAPAQLYPGPPRRTVPHCWKCNYELSGLGVDDNCPECGTPIWSKPPVRAELQNAMRMGSRAQMWGILSLVFFFACIGPLAAFLTIPAFIYASKADRIVRQGLATRGEVSGITSARVCSWITLSFTILTVGLYGLMLLGLFFV